LGHGFQVRQGDRLVDGFHALTIAHAFPGNKERGEEVRRLMTTSRVRPVVY
jgi:hypothetical protein